MRLNLKTALLAALVVLLAWSATGLSITNDMMRLMPAEGPLTQAITEMRRFEVADTLVLEVDGTGQSREALLSATDHLAKILVDSGQFEKLRHTVGVADGAAIRDAMLPHATALADAEALSARVSPEGVSLILRTQLARLAGPAGGMFERPFLQDPLDIAGLALDGIQHAQGPFDLTIAGGHLLDRDGERALILTHPKQTALQIGSDADLVSTVEAAIAKTPLPVSWFGGHRIAAEAATSAHRDIQRGGTLGLIGLALVFLVGFRSIRPIIGAALPLSLGLLAAAAVAGLRSPIHAINMGFVAALMGLGVDYWVHLYVEASRRGGSDRAERLIAAQQALAEIKPALTISGLSTVAAFLALSLSRYPVVADLGATGAATIIGVLLGTILLGPQAYAWLGGRPVRPVNLTHRPRLGTVLVGITVISVGLSAGSTFDGDPRALNFIQEDTAAVEREFAARYGGFGTGGMITTTANDLPAALAMIERAEAVVRDMPGASVSGPLTVLPGAAALARRRAVLPPVDVLQARIEDAATAAGIRAGSVAGAAQNIVARLSPPTPKTWVDTPISDITTGHVTESETGASAMLSVVFADDHMVQTASELLEARAPGVTLIHPASVAAAGVDEIRGELVKLGGLSGIAVALLLLFRYRDPKKIAAALLPPAAAIGWTGAAFMLWGLPWNAVSASAMVLIIGLALDYGVFMTENAHRTQGWTLSAVALSALTTACGFGSLLAASNPALNGVGAAVLIGLGAAVCLAAVATPLVASGTPLFGPRARTVVRRLAFAALMLLHLDVLIQVRFYLTEPDVPAAEMVRKYTLETNGLDDRTYGPNRLVRDNGVWIMYLEGSPYEMGLAHGILAADLRHMQEVDLLESFEATVPLKPARWLIERGSMVMARNLDRTFPIEYLVELRGLTDSTPDPLAWLAPTYTRKLYYHAIHDIGQGFVDSPLLACTGFIAGPDATANGDWIMGRNFDFDGGPLFDREKIIAFRNPDEGLAFVSVTFAGMIGAVTGMNEDRLTVAIQAAGTDDSTRLATPMTILIRQILQDASSIDEAVAILDAQKGFVSEAVLLIDGDAGQAAIVEVSPARIAVLDVTDMLGQANHFRSETFADDETNADRRAHSTTGHRQARMDELLAEHKGLIDMGRSVQILSDRRGEGGTYLPSGHRWALDADIATHSAVLNATTGEILVSKYPNQSGGFISLNLDDGLSGELTTTDAFPAGDIHRAIRSHRARKLLRKSRRSGGSKALTLAQEAQAIWPDHPEALWTLGALLHDQGDDEQARPLLEAALAAPPEYTHQADEIREILAEMSP